MKQLPAFSETLYTHLTPTTMAIPVLISSSLVVQKYLTKMKAIMNPFNGKGFSGPLSTHTQPLQSIHRSDPGLKR